MLVCNSSTREKGQRNPSTSLDSQSGQAAGQRPGEEKLSENRQIDGQTDIQTDGRTDEWMNRWMDGQAGWQTDWWQSIGEYVQVPSPDLHTYMHIGMYTTSPHKVSKNSGTTGKNSIRKVKITNFCFSCFWWLSPKSMYQQNLCLVMTWFLLHK